MAKGGAGGSKRQLQRGGSDANDKPPKAKAKAHAPAPTQRDADTQDAASVPVPADAPTLQSIMELMQKGFTDVQKRLDKVDAIEDDLNMVKGQVQSIQTSLQSQDERLKKLEDDKGYQDYSDTRLDKAVEELRVKISQLETNQDKDWPPLSSHSTQPQRATPRHPTPKDNPKEELDYPGQNKWSLGGSPKIA